MTLGGWCYLIKICSLTRSNRVGPRVDHLGTHASRFLLAENARRGEHDAVFVASYLRRNQTIGDIVAHPHRFAREGVAVTTPGRADTNKSVAGADLHMRNLRRQHLYRPV